MTLTPIASPLFLRKKKREFSDFQEELDKQIKNILQNPLVAEPKKGLLKGIRVHKFKYKNQLYLLSYEPNFKTNELYLYTYGTHEGFYRDLERYIK